MCRSMPFVGAEKSDSAVIQLLICEPGQQFEIEYGASEDVAVGDPDFLSDRCSCCDRDTRAGFAAKALAMIDELMDNPMTDIATVSALQKRLLEMSL